MSGFEHRGVIEGFYGTPYSHPDRLWWIDRLGAWGMNRYVHGPKDDPLHRAEWRSAYAEDRMREFAELVERGERNGVEVAFALSPGLSIEYSSATDREALRRKLAAFLQIGARGLCLALDDVPTHLTHASDRSAYRSLAEAHASIAHDVAELAASAASPGAGEVRIYLVPTDYLGVESTDYLSELGETLAPGIEIAWTGRTVVSPTVDAGEARQRAATLRRRILLWDNVPVADGPMRPMLHLGPYLGRDPDLAEHVSGVLLNPMQRAHASAPNVRTAARYLSDPCGYDAEAEWCEALSESGDGAEEAFALFARAHRFWCGDPDARDTELEGVLDAVRNALADEADPLPSMNALSAAAALRVAAADTLRERLSDRALAAEIEPWIAAHHAESLRIAAAAQCLEGLFAGGSRLERALAFFGFEGKLTRIAAPPVASYGPRRVLYPQLTSMHDEGAALGADAALFRDRNLADEIVAFTEQTALRCLAGRADTPPPLR